MTIGICTCDKCREKYRKLEQRLIQDVFPIWDQIIAEGGTEKEILKKMQTVQNNILSA